MDKFQVEKSYEGSAPEVRALRKLLRNISNLKILHNLNCTSWTIDQDKIHAVLTHTNVKSNT